MKQIYLLLFFALPSLCFGQKSKTSKPEVSMPVSDGKVIYTEVVTVDSASASDLYQRAKRFFVDHYKSAKDVIQLDDEKNGEVTGKGNFQVYWSRGIIGGVSPRIHHTLSVYVKDGKFKYELKDLVVDYYEKGSTYVAGHEVTLPIEGFANSKMKMHQRLEEDVHKEALNTIEQLKLAMSKPIVSKSSDW